MTSLYRTKKRKLYHTCLCKLDLDIVLSLLTFELGG